MGLFEYELEVCLDNAVRLQKCHRKGLSLYHLEAKWLISWGYYNTFHDKSKELIRIMPRIPIKTYWRLNKGDVLSIKVNMKLKFTFLDLSMINTWCMLWKCYVPWKSKSVTMLDHFPQSNQFPVDKINFTIVLFLNEYPVSLHNLKKIPFHVDYYIILYKNIWKSQSRKYLLGFRWFRSQVFIFFLLRKMEAYFIIVSADKSVI